MPDGRKKARIYAGLIHYKNPAGNYENIDPKLIRASSANQGSRALMKTTADSYDYEYVDGLYTASFKRDLFEENSVRISLESGYTFKTSLVGIGYFNTNSHEYRLFNDFNPVLIEPEDAQLTYSDPLMGVDIKYSYMTESLKEEIYLNQKFRDALPEPEQYGWDEDNTEFVIITEINPDVQLEAYVENFNQEIMDEYPVELTQFTEFNALSFKDFEGSPRFYLPQNFASSGSFQTMIEDTTDITPLNSYILPGENEKAYIAYGLAYNEFISFPEGDIYIDPTIIMRRRTADTYLNTSRYLHGRSSTLGLGNNKFWSKTRTVIKFSDLGNSPWDYVKSYANIHNASLNLYYCYKICICVDWDEYMYCLHKEEFIPRDIAANLILVPWCERTASVSYPWSVPYGAFGVDYAATSEDVVHFGLPPAWKSFDLTSAVQKWVDGTIENNGVVLWATNENIDGCSMWIRSSEYYNMNYRPYMEVEYSGGLNSFKVTTDKDTISHNDTTRIFVNALDEYGNFVNIPEDVLINFILFRGDGYKYGNLMSPDGEKSWSTGNIAYSDAKSGKVKFVADGDEPDSSVQVYIDVYEIRPFYYSFRARGMGSFIIKLEEFVRFSQTDSLWGDDVYDTYIDTIITRQDGTKDTLYHSIGAKGCALACMAMVLKACGVDTDPGKLNTWLINNSGFDGFAVRWFKFPNNDKIKFHDAIGGGLKSGKLVPPSEINNCLQKSNIIVAEVKNPTSGKSHWVILKEKTNGKYNIVDPGYGDRKTLDVYGNNVYRIIIYEKKDM